MNPWFRMYSEIIDDEKLLLLAFEDRWHYVAILALKNKGVLDEGDPSLIWRKVAVKLGLDLRTLEEVARRLAEVGLVDERSLQPLAWDRRQYISDTSTKRVRAHRERVKQDETLQKQDETVSVTPPDTDTDTDTEKGQEIGAKAKRFRPPTAEEVATYCQERGNSVNPQKFVDHYEGNGWMRGKTKMKDWKAVIRTWEQNEDEKRTRPSGSGSQARQVADRLDDIIRNGLPEERTERMGGRDLPETPGSVRKSLDGEYQRH